MSTRSQIGFYGGTEKDLNNWQALIYRHSDGYPDGVLPDIMPFLKWWKKDTGRHDDTEYTSARLLQYMTNLHDGRYQKHWEKAEEKGLTGVYGHGICKDFHGDIEYFYAVYPDRVDVYETDFNFEGDKTINEITKKIKTELID